MQTKSIFYDSSNTSKVSRVKLNMEVVSALVSPVYEVSTDGGTSWQTLLALNTWASVTQGNDLRLKVTATSGELSKVELDYEIA